MDISRLPAGGATVTTRSGVVNEERPGGQPHVSLTHLRRDDYDRFVACRDALFALALLWLGAPGSRAEGKRFLVDEVVAVVSAHSITLSEVRAEARIGLVQEHGAGAARIEPDRGLLAATLQRMIDQRLVLSEL